MDVFAIFDKTITQDVKTFPLSEDASIDLLPMGSDLAKRKFEQMMEPYQPRLKAGGELSEEENKRLNLRFFSEVIVKGWKGLKDAEGKDIKFSAEAAAKLFEALPRLFALVVRMASDEEAFSAAREEDEAKN